MKSDQLIFRIPLIFILTVSTLYLVSCEENNIIDPPIPPDPDQDSVVVKPSILHQEMVGFGAALTWYSDRIVTSSKSEEIYQLLFDDLGMDILRLKNWYYPANYPENKSPETMLTSGDKTMFNATNTFFTKAKEYNPQMKVLLSSWGPPPSLKSNDNLREGTLKKDENGFMYSEFATYWDDVLSNIAFDPEYISIQNEPSYTNPGWTTCKWTPTESLSLAGYQEAFDSVYARIKDRPDAPEMIGPESANVTAFNSFAPVVKNKDYCPVYAYHPYGFNDGTSSSEMVSYLKNIENNFGDKPNIMTEYSGMNWFNTARLIQNTLRYANTSGYIYWEGVWGDVGRSEYPLIYINSSGEYTVNAFYYLLKHFARYIDAGYQRVEVTSTIATIEVTGYLNTAGTELTLIIINSGSDGQEFVISTEGHDMTLITAVQSIENNYYDELTELVFEGELYLPSKTLTTMVFSLN